MRSKSILICLSIAVSVLAIMIFPLNRCTVPQVEAQQPAEDQLEEEAEQEENEELDKRKARREAELLERRLDEIERAIDKALDGGDEDRAKELRREGEKILERLDELEDKIGGEEDEDEEAREQEQRELEMRRLHLELERAELETGLGRLEMAARMAQIARDETASAAYAVIQVQEYMELPTCIGYLKELLGEVTDPAVRRVIQMRLAELHGHMDQPDEARSQLRKLILLK